MGDFSWRIPCDVVAEDAPDDRGLFVDNFELSSFPENGSIAVSPPAGVASVANDTCHAATHLMCQVGQKKRT